MVSDILLEARELCFVRHGDAGPLRVLDGASLSVRRGEVVDISGPSGVGKTTLLRALALMQPGASGELVLGGQSADDIGPREWRTRVALVPQRPAIFPGNVRQNLLMPWTLKVRADAKRPGEDELRAALDGVGLADVALDREASKLSVGQAARIALLRAVLTVPDVLLLDEPDAALDADSAAQVAALIARCAKNGAVVRVRHQRPDAVRARRLRLSAGCLRGVGDSD